jgi:hypothetical protein
MRGAYIDKNGDLYIDVEEEPKMLEMMMQRHGIDGQLAKELRSVDPHMAIQTLLDQGYALPGGIKQVDPDVYEHERLEQMSNNAFKEMELTAKAIDKFPEMTQDDLDAHREDNLGLVWDEDVGGWVRPKPLEPEKIPWNDPEALAEYAENQEKERVLERFEAARRARERQAIADEIDAMSDELEEADLEEYDEDDDED